MRHVTRLLCHCSRQVVTGSHPFDAMFLPPRDQSGAYSSNPGPPAAYKYVLDSLAARRAPGKFPASHLVAVVSLALCIKSHPHELAWNARCPTQAVHADMGGPVRALRAPAARHGVALTRRASDRCSLLLTRACVRFLTLEVTGPTIGAPLQDTGMGAEVHILITTFINVAIVVWFAGPLLGAVSQSQGGHACTERLCS